MQLAQLHATAPVDPIAFALVELRGPRTAPGALVDTLEVGAYAADAGRALVHEGRFRDALGPVRRHTTWLSDELFLLPDADPDAALRDARQAVAQLMSSVDAVSPQLAAFAHPTGVPVPREADSVELVLRRDSGARERYVVPLAQAPAALRDAIAAARGVATMARTYFRENETPQAPTR